MVSELGHVGVVLPVGEKANRFLRLCPTARLLLTRKIMRSRSKQLHDRFFELVSYLQSPFLLLIRLYWGWQLIQSGWGKLHHLSNVTDFFTSLGLPLPAQTAVAISCLEFFGGVFLAIGLLSRITALAMTINLIVAYITADREALFSIFSDPDKFYAAAPFTFLFASLIILIFGPGKIALDTPVDRWLGAPTAPESRSLET
jgi:putative oxidoreductase